MNDRPTVQADVMDAIRKGRVHMRPRWHFVLLSALAIVGAFIMLLALLYIVSLAVFFLRDSGTLFAPTFGPRGWFVLLHAIPWLLLILIVPFFIMLELLVKRYSFVYRKPLLVSIGGILVLIFVGGFFIGLTPFHRELYTAYRNGALPGPVGMWYRPPLKMPPPQDAFRGQILLVRTSSFVIVDRNGSGTTTVLIGPHTKLPDGAGFAPGDEVMIIGDRTGTGTVQAFGIKEMQ